MAKTKRKAVGHKRKVTKGLDADLLEMPEARIPEFMKDDLYRGLPGLRPDSAAWLGEDGALDPEKLLAVEGYDPTPPLDSILIGLIAGNTSKDSLSVRLSAARKAIGAENPKGPAKKADYGLLLDMGWRYLAQNVERPGRSIEIEPIARQCIAEADPSNRRREGSDHSRVKRLAKKFNAEKDLILSRITMDPSPARVDRLRAIADILERMRALGIKVSFDHLRPVPIPRK